jgi:CHAT domain-containing protein/tetratricopeptide (TPR) repeat protein
LGIFRFYREIPREYQSNSYRRRALKAILIAAICLFAIPLGGPGGRVKPKSPSFINSQPRSSLRDRLAITESLFRAERYQEALTQSQQLIAAASAAGDSRTATRATGNLGGLRFALHQYRGALESFLEARRMALAIGDSSFTATIDANLCLLYMQMGDLEEAGRRMQGTLEKLSGYDRLEHLAQAEMSVADLRAQQHRMAEALPLFRASIEHAQSRGEWKQVAFTWNRLGEDYLKQGDLRRAESPLLEAYRIRNLHNLPLDTSYRNLGRLRLEQGDLGSAAWFLNRAVEVASRPQGSIPSWDVYHYRGRLRLAQGRLPEAMSDLRTAVRLGRAWRWSAPLDDASRIGAEGWLDLVYSALIDAGNRLFQQTGNRSLVRETFEAVEENRANSLRQLVQGRMAAAEALPSSYWPAVARLQRAEVEAARVATPAAEQEALSARAAISRIESVAFNASSADSDGLLARIRAELSAGDALIAFHLGDSVSWMWAVSRNRIAVYPLPPREEIETLAAAFSEAVQNSSPDVRKARERLYAALFGSLAPEFLAKNRWLLALDRALFQVPFAALSEGDLPPMVERRVIEVVPGAALWTNRPSRPTPGLFLGIGDPVYNRADPRRADSTRGRSQFQPVSFTLLPRLVASASELKVSADAWTGGHELLEGPDASRAALTASLARNPSVIHFATHFVESVGRGPEGAIALSLDGNGQPEKLDPAQIATWRVNADLVALSGCNSAAGAILPGSGLFGLTRAWLAAGARSVLASHWPVADDGGPLFAAFYRNLSRLRLSPAAALRAAQMEMAASGGWRANPRYWAAYFVMGKE